MPRMSVVPLGMSTKTVHPNSCGTPPRAPHVLGNIYHTHPALDPRGGLRVPPGVRLLHPLFEMIRTEVGVADCLMGAQAKN